MTYNEKTIYIKQKEDNNKERIFNIVTKSLEKYNNCLKFKELGEIKNGDKTNNPSKLIGTKNNDVLKVSMVENYIYSKKNKNKNIGETKIYYKINEIDNEVRLFGDDFVENNKAKCYIVNNGKKYPLKNYFSGNSKSKNIVIHLIEINKITKLQRMFEGCSSLESLPDISKWNTNNVTNMSYLFYNRSSLESLPDISKWNTYNVKIKNAVICSFYAAHHEIKQRENSHELYGYDFMIDEDFNVYLIEVNASPALDYSTKITENAVKTMVKDLIEIVIDNNNGKNFRVNSNGEGRTNNKFVQIFNENRDNINIPKNVPNKNMFY